MDITSSQYQNQTDNVFAAKDGEALYSQQKKKRPRADYDSDHELLIEKISLKLKKVGKIPGPVSFDLNQIPYRR